MCGFSRLPLYQPAPPGRDPTTVSTGISDATAATLSFTGKNSHHMQRCVSNSLLSFFSFLFLSFFLRWATIYCVYEAGRGQNPSRKMIGCCLEFLLRSKKSIIGIPLPPNTFLLEFMLQQRALLSLFYSWVKPHALPLQCTRLGSLSFHCYPQG